MVQFVEQRRGACLSIAENPVKKNSVKMDPVKTNAALSERKRRKTMAAVWP